MAKYRVAVATNDGENVNVHFGHAAAFDVYEVDEESGKFEKVEVRVKPEHCSQLGPQAVQAVTRFNVRAFDIALPIADAIAKINIYRKKIAERLSKIKGLQDKTL